MEERGTQRLRTGCDLTVISRFEEILRRRGEDFVRRILSEEERREYEKLAEKQRSLFLARAFAGKEAFAKALGSGIGADCSFADLSLTHDAQGKPSFLFSSRLAARLERQRCLSFDLSLSHDAGLLLAFVVLLFEGEPGGALSFPRQKASSFSAEIKGRKDGRFSCFEEGDTAKAESAQR